MIIETQTPAFTVLLDRASPSPLYHQLVQQFTAAIESGVLKPGEALEREDLFAARLAVARPTLRRALVELASKGLITRSRGRGTEVVGPFSRTVQPAREAWLACPEPSDQAVLRLVRLEPDRVEPRAALDLGLDRDGALVYLEQLEVDQDKRISFRKEWLPGSLVGPVLHNLSTTPVRRVLADIGHATVRDQRTFEFRPPDATEKAALGLDDSERIFAVRIVAFDQGGTPIEVATVGYVNGPALGHDLRRAS